MIYQMIPSLISLIIGSALTLVVTYFSQTMTRKGDKNKIRREKLEEAYILLGELKYWLRVQLRSIRLIAPTDINDMWDERFKSPFWLLGELNIVDIGNIKCDCPIERIVMLISLYAPPLRNTVLGYELTVNLIRPRDPELLEMEQEIRNMQENEDYSVAKEKEKEETIKVLKALKMEQEIKMVQENEFSEANKQAIGFQFLYGVLHGCEETHQSLQASLEKIIAEI